MSNNNNADDSGMGEPVSKRGVSQDYFTEAQIEEAVCQLISTTIREFCEGGSTGNWVKQNECKCMEADSDGALKQN